MSCKTVFNGWRSRRRPVFEKKQAFYKAVNRRRPSYENAAAATPL